MRVQRLALMGALICAPASAHAQQPAYPPGLQQRAVAMAVQCQSRGGQVTNGDRPFVHNMDLTGDGRPEFIMDEAGFACSNRSVTSVTPTGAPLEVFDGATGQSLIRVMSFTYALTPGPARNTLMVTLRGPVCSPNAMATTTCQRPLTWNAQARAFTGGPGLDAARLPPGAGAQVAQAPPVQPGRDPLASGPAPKAASTPPPPPQPAAPPPAAGGMTLTDADKAAAFRAANFKLVGRKWVGCADDPREYYGGGEISEVVDLNADGRPEVVIAENSTFCHGQQGDWFTVLSKEANGSWRMVVETDGMFSPLRTRANGWLEIMVGGPGTGAMPVLRYNGRTYVLNRRQQP